MSRSEADRPNHPMPEDANPAPADLSDDVAYRADWEKDAQLPPPSEDIGPGPNDQQVLPG